MDGVVAVAVAFSVALVATPLVMRAAAHLGVVDRPGPLKTHRTPVAYLGGVAVFLGLVAGPLIAGRPLVLVPLALALALGAADDTRPLPARARLAAELALAAVAAACVPGPALARIATAGLLVVLLNAVNLLDGQDGLAAGFGVFAALGFATLGGDSTPVALALAGALGGFLIFNRPPARIYLGDGGAYLLGSTLALLPVLHGSGTDALSVWFATPLLVALAFTDTAIAILRRLRAHVPLFEGDRSHVYDQLVDRGWSVPASTLWCVGAQVPFAAAGAIAAHLDPGWALTVTGAGSLVVATVAMGSGLLSTEGAL
ncbi:MAG: undecaprenyl/decaprenyl-phosphate alpha-N-acetylglucosaminyl 1-phosphate transferase [Actinobacteria bacterium]|nr:undecaprenyl/decaprenyl-phosphate alpha-N-acetylglucosaminyl 1-phosphate transferase [Actinomycetota bacterium]